MTAHSTSSILAQHVNRLTMLAATLPESVSSATWQREIVSFNSQVDKFRARAGTQINVDKIRKVLLAGHKALCTEQSDAARQHLWTDLRGDRGAYYICRTWFKWIATEYIAHTGIVEDLVQVMEKYAAHLEEL